MHIRLARRTSWWPIILLLLTTPVVAGAASEAELRGILLRVADDDPAVRREAVMSLARTGDPSLEVLLEAYRLSSLYISEGKVVLCEETIEDDDLNELAPLADPLTRQPLLGVDGKPIIVPIEELETISPSRKERKLAHNAKFLLSMYSPDDAKRLSAVKRCGDPPRQVDALAQLAEMADRDANKRIRFAARESLLLIHLTEDLPPGTAGPDIETLAALAKMKSDRALPLLRERLAQEDLPLTDESRRAHERAVKTLEAYQRWVARFDSVKFGLSTGSILVLMGLGLAITFGLMGVINMAHGELMMIGAYATHTMQLLSGHTPDNPANWFYIAALPVSFLAAAAVGYLIEIAVVRHLYRRPLESLLATWGVSLILIQLIRNGIPFTPLHGFGDNRPANSPTWLLGNFELMHGMSLSYNRCFIFVLCAVCVLLVYALMKYTSVGLRMRATMQNREMASGVGVNTRRVDAYTFALGSGIAGIAGYALTTVGGITPDMGQNYIVDSFLVVVTGGVGELVGVVCSGLGIGMLNKIIEGAFLGAVWSKIAILILVVAFIQFKPAGLFPPKGRQADD